MPPTNAKLPFKFSTRTRVGVSDSDAQGIVYFGRYLPYFDAALIEYSRHLGMLRRREIASDFVVRANVVEYFAPALFDDEIDIYVRIARIGTTSVTYEFAAYRVEDGILLATSLRTLVHLELAERRKQPVPEEWSQIVIDFEGDDVER
jgi:acyl-CoA thioester hydrolase